MESRTAVLVLGVLSAASAVLGGVSFLWFHHGAEFLPIGLLESTPFATFLIPGLLLTFVVGGTSLLATVAVARRWDTRVDLTILAGGTLTLWIVVEMALLRGVYWLHVLYGLLGVALLALGIRAALGSGIPRHRWIVLVTVFGAIGFLVIAVAGVLAAPRVGAGMANIAAVSVLVAGSLAWGVVAATAGLQVVGLARWIELRRHGRAGTWIGWSTLAWAIAFPLSLTPAPLVDEATPLAVHLVVWPCAGLLMAYVMALVTWPGARRLAEA